MKVKFCFVVLFLFFYLLNVITPMSFGDDYVYSFIWEGHSLYEPMSENALRISSWEELFVSQVHHYYTWSGRIVNHTLEQFFLWVGKSVFNICNAGISVLLVAEIYWCSHKGAVIANFHKNKIYGIFVALWLFSPGFGDVFLWLGGACNYLWSTVLLIGFLLPYIHKYYSFSERIHTSNAFCLCMFFLGLAAGCTNENTIWCIIPILLFFIFEAGNKRKDEKWLYFGVAGLIAGYLLLMFAPGNMARLLAEKKGYSWLNWEGIKTKAALLFLVFMYFHVFLWYFNLRSFYILYGKDKDNRGLAKELLLAKLTCIVSFSMTFVMLFSPSFLPRSAFPGTVFLIVTACILLRIQDDYEITLIKNNAKKFLCIVGVIIFGITSIVTTYGAYYYYQQIQELISFVKTSDYAKRNVIVVNSLRPVPDIINKASWFHLNYYKMSDDENDWRNVAFSRYYGIKGIRMIKNNGKME